MVLLNKKILVAMSGGVDSSVAAFLLKKQGYQVAGCTMRIWPDKSSQNIKDARRVCKVLGIKHYALDIEKEFKKCVVDSFAKEYLNGRTPNPCIICNERIKFGVLLKKAEKMGYEHISTGHYVQVQQKNKSARKECLLKKGKDLKKDQSYMLYRLKQAQLKKVVLPLGKYKKDEVRKIAVESRLPVAHRPESQEICFVDKDYATFLIKYLGRPCSKIKPGDIVDQKGNVLGSHKGLPFYTIGQRSGLGIAYAHPLYVNRIDAKHNRLIVGAKQDVFSKDMQVKSVNWISGHSPRLPLRCNAKIRYLHKESRAVISKSGAGFKVVFSKPQMAITPGQSAVFYMRDRVLGGGIIA